MSTDLQTRVQDLIDSTINPAVAGHGGFVQLVDVNSSTGGPYYYEIRDFNGTCGAEGP